MLKAGTIKLLAGIRKLNKAVPTKLRSKAAKHLWSRRASTKGHAKFIRERLKAGDIVNT